MGRNRKKAGTGTVEAQRYDIFGTPAETQNVRENRVVLKPNQYGNGLRYSNENMPPGWKLIGNGNADFVAVDDIGTDPVTGKTRFITVRNTDYGNNFAAVIDGEPYFLPVQDVTDYVVNPDAPQSEWKLNMGRLASDIQQGIKALDSRRKERQELEASMTEQRRIVRALEKSFPPVRMPERGASDRDYELYLRSSNSTRPSANDITGSLKRLGMNELQSVAEELRKRLNTLSNSIASLQQEPNAQVRRQAKQYLYNMVATTMEYAAQVGSEVAQRRSLGEYLSYYDYESRQTFFQPFGSLFLARRAYRDFNNSVAESIRNQSLGRGQKRAKTSIVRDLTTVPEPSPTRA